MIVEIQTEHAAKAGRRSTIQTDNGSLGGRSSMPGSAGMNARGNSETIATIRKLFAPAPAACGRTPVR